jgi:hypothetical protein
MKNWVRLRATKNEIEANMIRHRLMERKIPCQLFNITSSRMFAELNERSLGVEIMVPQKFLLKGKKIIDELENGL